MAQSAAQPAVASVPGIDTQWSKNQMDGDFNGDPLKGVRLGLRKQTAVAFNQRNSKTHTSACLTLSGTQRGTAVAPISIQNVTIT